jgi:hypothetical protein
VNIGVSATSHSSCGGISISPTFVSFMYEGCITLITAAPCLYRTGWSF